MTVVFVIIITCISYFLLKAENITDLWEKYISKSETVK